MRAEAEGLGWLEAWPARLSCRDEHPDLQVREIGGTRFECGSDFPTHAQ